MSRRQRLFSKRKVTHAPASPGTLVAPEGAMPPAVSVMAYDAERLVERELASSDDLASLSAEFPMLWIDVTGLGDAEVLKQLGDFFGLHALALEDVLNTHHRPKVEDYDQVIFIVLRMATIDEGRLDMAQVSLFLGEHFVITCQERPCECLEPVRRRIRDRVRRERFVQPDYLTYAVIDAIIDGYFPVLEHFDERLNALEDQIVENPERDLVTATHDLKREFHVLRHGIWPLREALRRLSDQSPRIHEETKPFLRDCYDHVVQIVEILETFTERTAALTDLYLSSLSFKMNETMKVLTVIATIFIPLSFIASVYGMNFDRRSPFNMPELGWYFGYPLALGLMVVVAVGLVIYFIRRGWVSFRR
jgi:magnesium transporter